MSDGFEDVLGRLRPEDLALDPSGRVVVANAEVAEQLKAVGGLTETALRNDTNIICCGNKSCAAANELGALVERMAGGSSR